MRLPSNSFSPCKHFNISPIIWLKLSRKMGIIELLCPRARSQRTGIEAFPFRCCSGLCSTSKIAAVIHYLFMLLLPSLNVEFQKIVMVIFCTLFKEESDISNLGEIERKTSERRATPYLGIPPENLTRLSSLSTEYVCDMTTSPSYCFPSCRCKLGTTMSV